METLLALDIHDDFVVGVLLETGQKVNVVRGYGVAAAKERPLAEAVADVIRLTGYTEGECRVSLGAGSFFFRNLHLPFTDKSKIERVLPFELEELTSYRMEGLHLDFIASTAHDDGTEILAAMVDRDLFAERLAMLKSLGHDPEIFGVSGLHTAASFVALGEKRFVMLEVTLRHAVIILVDEGEVVLVRSLTIDLEHLGGFSYDVDQGKLTCSKPEHLGEVVRQLVLPLQQTLLAVERSDLFEQRVPCFIDGGVGLYPELFDQLQRELSLDVQPCNVAKQPLLKIEPVEGVVWTPAVMNRALALALWKRKDCQVFNFRRGDFKKRYSLKKIRKTLASTAIPLAIAGFGLIGFALWEYSDLLARQDGLRREIEGVFRETLPEVNRIVNPVQQLQVRIDETRAAYRSGSQGLEGASKLALLSELSARIPQSLDIRITRLVADQNDVRIKAETTDFNTVDNVKKELEKSDYFSSVVISSANLAPRGGEVRFELKLEFRQ